MSFFPVISQYGNENKLKEVVLLPLYGIDGKRNYGYVHFTSINESECTLTIFCPDCSDLHSKFIFDSISSDRELTSRFKITTKLVLIDPYKEIKIEEPIA